MIKFGNNDFVSCPGDPLKVVYAPKVLENGNITLIEAGVENLQEKIDSFADSTDILNIVSRFQNSGDVTVLNRAVGSFGDFTSMPRTYAEALQMKIDSDRLYDSLPVDVKEKFGNDRNSFFALAGTKDWCVAMNDFLPESMRVSIPEVKSSVPEVKANES